MSQERKFPESLILAQFYSGLGSSGNCDGGLRVANPGAVNVKCFLDISCGRPITGMREIRENDRPCKLVLVPQAVIWPGEMQSLNALDLDSMDWQGILAMPRL